jgi:hypothetical protein
MELIAIDELVTNIKKYLDTEGFRNVRLVCKFFRDKFPLTNIWIEEDDINILRASHIEGYIEKLSLHPSSADRSKLPDLSHLPKLRYLRIMESRFLPEELTQLTKLFLGIEDKCEPDEEILKLNCLTNLTDLTYWGNVFVEGIANLTKLKKLQCSSLSYRGRINLSILKGLTSLTCISSENITEELTKLTNLKRLTTGTYDHLNDILPHLTNLTGLKLKESHESVNWVSLSHLVKLEKLALGYGVRFGEDSIKPPSLAKLRELHFYVDDINSLVFRLTQLTKLRINTKYFRPANVGKHVIDRCLKHLTNLTYLKTVNPISNDGLIGLLKLKYFSFDTKLTRQNIKITGSAFKNLPDMREIMVGGTLIYCPPLPAKFDNLSIDKLWEENCPVLY